jgi:ribosome-associated toxin RatA of RatAB toxin-antitoxin module
VASACCPIPSSMRTAGRDWPSRWIALALVPGVGAAQGVSPAWPQSAALDRGEVVMRVDEDGRFRGHIELAVLIAASPERIWGVLRDCASAPEYVPHVQSCELVERLDEPYSAMTLSRVDGPLGRLDGRWTLQPRADGKTLLQYVLDFEPGLPVPRFLVARSMLRDLPEVLQEVRRRAELPP